MLCRYTCFGTPGEGDEVVSPEPTGRAKRTQEAIQAEKAAARRDNCIVVRVVTLARWSAAGTMVDGWPVGTKLDAVLHLLAHELIHALINNMAPEQRPESMCAGHSWLFRNLAQVGGVAAVWRML